MGIEASNESSQIATSAAFDPPCSMTRNAGYRFVKREKARRYSSGRTGSAPIPSSVPPSGRTHSDARSTKGTCARASSTVRAISGRDVDSGIFRATSDNTDWTRRDCRTSRSAEMPPSLRIRNG